MIYGRSDRGASQNKHTRNNNRIIYEIMKTKHLIIAAAMAFVGLSASATAPATCCAAKAAPKYVFLFIGDGMGMGPVMSTLAYQRMAHPTDTLVMSTFPVVSWCQTYSASSPVTDSAAAGTALSTGTKTKNTMLGMGPDTVAVTSIARQFKDKGWGVGIITTVAPDDATPGAFYTHVPNRNMFYQIDCDAAASGYDFIAGAGLRGLKDKDGKPTDVLERFAAAGVSVVHGLDTMPEATPGTRVLLLSPEGVGEDNNVGYTIDSVPEALKLPEMTRVGLTYVQRTAAEPGRPFFMMIEGGNIDHALHGNDGGAAIKEIINFDQAIRVAYDFYLQHPDETLIVITADHDTGGMTLGNNVLHYDAKPQLIDSQRVSKEEFSAYCKGILKSRRIYRWDDMKEYLTDKLGLFTIVPVSAEQEKTLRDKFEACFTQRNSADEKTLYASFNAFAVDVFRHLNGQTGFGFTTTSHTGNPVPVFAVGVGACRFKSLNNNKNIPEIIRTLTGL